MTEVETTLRQGLEAFAAETAGTALPPSLSFIERRAGSPSARTRRWPKVTIATVAGVVVTSGAAAALGVLPEPVESVLREFRSQGFDANQGAERMAWVTDGDMTYEVWRAPLDGGGQCVYDRVIGPEGDIDHGGDSHCQRDALPPRSPDQFGELHYPERVFDNSSGRVPEWARQHSVSSGQLPVGASRVVFEFDDGTTLTVTPQQEGYFVTTFPGVQDGVRIVEIRAMDAAGHVVAGSGPSIP